MKFHRRVNVCFLSALLVCAFLSRPVLAYRPFDGTDADVVKPGTLEIEFQPAGVIREGDQRRLIAPATVLNFGLLAGWEAIVEGRGQFPLANSDERATLTDAGLFLKSVLRPGSLQGKSGPSIATEFGVLLPGINADSGYGASLAWIVSNRWDWGTVHLNFGTALTRDQRTDVFVGSIIEGPINWTVRPVLEVFYEDEVRQFRTVSGLIGAIWKIDDNLSFDVGFRHAVSNGQPINEVRIGLTVGFALRPLIPVGRNVN